MGDGINDTPAFAVSDLSLAVGDGGADVTIEYADIVLQKGGLKKVARTLEIGQEKLDIIKKSYFMAISLNLAAFGLTTSGLISPVAGALMHNLTTALSVGNAARLSTRDKKKTR